MSITQDDVISHPMFLRHYRLVFSINYNVVHLENKPLIISHPNEYALHQNKLKFQIVKDTLFSKINKMSSGVLTLHVICGFFLNCISSYSRII